MKGLQWNMTKQFGVMDMFIILVVMMVLHIFTYIKTYQTAHFKYFQFNCTLIRAVFFFLSMRQISYVHRLKISPHKILNDYKGKITSVQERNLVDTTLTK